MGNTKTLKMIQEIIHQRKQNINHEEKHRIQNEHQSNYFIDELWNTQEKDAMKLAEIGMEEIY